MDKLVNWIKNLDVGSKIAYGVLVLSLIISMLILSARMNSKNEMTSSQSVITVTPTKKVASDFDTKSEVKVSPTATQSASVSITPKATKGVSSQIVTPSKSLTPTLIPTLTPSLTPTLIPTLTPIPTTTLTPTITPTPGPTSTPTNTLTPIPTAVLLSKITLSANDVFLYSGEKQQITVYFEPSDVSDKNLTWTYDGNVVDITADGLVTAKNAGKTNVIVYASNKKSTLLKVTVNPSSLLTSTPSPTVTPTGKISVTPTLTPSLKLTTTPTINVSSSVTGISVSPTSITIDEGAQQKLTFNVIPSNAKNPGLTWSYDGYIMSMDSSGLVTGKNAGRTTIIFRTSNGITKSVSVTVKPKPTATPTPTKTAAKDGLVIDLGKGIPVCDLSNKTVATSQCGYPGLMMTGHCTDRTLCDYGCGLASVSTILRGHDAKNIPPCLLSTDSGCDTAFTGAGSCPVSWTTMARTLRLNLGNGALYNDGEKFKCNKSSIAEMICAGYVVIVNFQYTWGSGHWLVATAALSTGDIALKDPSFSDTQFNYWSDFIESKPVKPANYCMAVEASAI